jgi:hypothetical protein
VMLFFSSVGWCSRITSMTWFDVIRASHHWGSNSLTLIPGKSIRSTVLNRSVVLMTSFTKFIVDKFFDLIESFDPLRSHMLLTTSKGGVSGVFFLLRTALMSRSRILSM